MGASKGTAWNPVQPVQRADRCLIGVSLPHCAWTLHITSDIPPAWHRRTYIIAMECAPYLDCQQLFVIYFGT